MIEHSIDENNNLDQLTKIIDNATYEIKVVPFLAACQVGCLKLFQMIIKFIDLRSTGFIFLRKAAFFGHVKIVALLLEHKVLDYENPQIKSLLEISGNDLIVNTSALHLAARQGHIEIVKLLLENGADVNITTTYGNTPLIESVTQNNFGVIKHLLESGADTNICSKSNGLSPLHLAALSGNFEIAELLLKHGARLDNRITYNKPVSHADSSENEFNGATALCLAAENGHAKVVSLLLANGAKVDSLSCYDVTPLMRATRSGHTEVVEILLNNGANCNIRNSATGFTSLHHAVAMEHVEIVHLLIQNGADLDFPSTYKRLTPLHCASQEGHLTVAKVLVDNGADINFKGILIGTPLHAAAMFGHVEMVAFLLEKGARPDVTLGDNFTTPLRLAAELGHRNVVNLLIKSGAEVRLRICVPWEWIDYLLQSAS